MLLSTQKLLKNAKMWTFDRGLISINADEVLNYIFRVVAQMIYI